MIRVIIKHVYAKYVVDSLSIWYEAVILIMCFVHLLLLLGGELTNNVYLLFFLFIMFGWLLGGHLHNVFWSSASAVAWKNYVMHSHNPNESSDFQSNIISIPYNCFIGM